MFVKDCIRQVQGELVALMKVLTRIAGENLHTIMPGYTHLQKAQPITLAHHMMAYFQMLRRDWQRLEDAYTRADVMPLGSGALAGTTYPLDRRRVADLLGFAEIRMNSLDGVSDRDFVIEYVSAASHDNDAPEPLLRGADTLVAATSSALWRWMTRFPPAPPSCLRRRTRTCAS